MRNKYSSLKLENQLCFPLYACSKGVTRMYKPMLDELDLTYTQYITMMVLWDCNKISVKKLGEKLYLDSGTLTPLLKKLEEKHYITRERSKIDERILEVSVTDEGMELRERALDIPQKMADSINLSHKESLQLYSLLMKMINAQERNKRV